MTRLMGIKLEFISILYEERNVKLTNRERERGGVRERRKRLAGSCWWRSPGGSYNKLAGRGWRMWRMLWWGWRVREGTEMRKLQLLTRWNKDIIKVVE